MNVPERLSLIDDAHWPVLHRRACAADCGRVLDRDAERLAAADELVAVALPQLVRVSVLALLVEGPKRPPRECTCALNRRSAALVRLLDRALAAHGRDTGYVVDAWLEHACDFAQDHAVVVATLEPDELPLRVLVDATAEALGDVVMALRRDRLAVPEGLAHALASGLVLYAASTEIDG